jgi:hypothetical protein
MPGWWGRSAAAVLLICGLGACGLTNPDIKEVWDPPYPGNFKTGSERLSATALIEFEIKKKIYCELKDAVIAASSIPTQVSDTQEGQRRLVYSGLFPPGWIAQIALSLQVDESSALTPSLTINQFYANAVKTFGVGNTVTVPQTFNLALGGTLSSTATRIDKFNPQYSIAFLSLPYTRESVCNPGKDPFEPFVPHSSPFLIESQLGIRDWLVGAMIVDDYLPSDFTKTKSTIPSARRARSTTAAAAGPSGSDAQGTGGASTKADSISYEIKFAIVSNGNINPTWKLLRVSANTGSNPLFGMGRTRTHDLIITIGPDTPSTQDMHLASQIAAGVSSANQAILNSK